MSLVPKIIKDSIEYFLVSRFERLNGRVPTPYEMNRFLRLRPRTIPEIKSIDTQIFWKEELIGNALYDTKSGECMITEMPIEDIRPPDDLHPV